MSPRPKTSFLRCLFFGHVLVFFAAVTPHALAQAVKPNTDPMPPSRTQTSTEKKTPVQSTSHTADEEDIVELGRFEVTASSRGYYQDVTMAGTRIGSNILDLGSSITAVTTEMMDDFGMTDINDIFNFEVGTEGAATFTDVTVDANGNVTDGNMDDRSGANRVRGLARPTRTYAFFEVIGLPTDRLIMSGATIIRGPNSIIGGLGSPAGIQDSTPIMPSLTKNKTEVRMRLFSDNSFRQTLDIHRVLIPRKLAIAAQQMYNHTAYQRKPSGLDMELYNFAVKYQPFKNTTLNVNYTRVRQSGNAANSITPGDGITPWRERGEYTWDPMQAYSGGASYGVIYDKNENVVRNGFPGSAYAQRNTYGITSMWQTSGQGSSLIYVDRGGVVWWGAPRSVPDAETFVKNVNSDTQLPGTYNYAMSLQMPVHDPNLPLPINYGAVRGVSDQDLYDWTRINIAATDRRYVDDDALMVRLAQTLIDTPNQYLAVELGWFREDTNAYRKLLMGKGKKNTTSSYLAIDINRNNLDGSKNLNFKRPYLAVNQDIVNEQPIKNDSYRAQLAYNLDFRRNKGWTRWLGRHSVTGYAEYKQYEMRNYNYRHALVSDHAITPAGTARGNSNVNSAANTGLPWDQVSNTLTRNYALYYMGDPVGQNIDYSPGTLHTGQYAYIWGDASTGVFTSENATLGLAADLSGSGGIANTLKISKGAGMVVQSHFLMDGVVVTIGRRFDAVYQKDGVPPRLMPDGITFDRAYNNKWEAAWRDNSGHTKTEGVVVHPAAWIKGNAPAWLRPLRHFSFFYNQSNSIDLNVNVGYNLKGEVTPNPTGKGKDYGFNVKLFKDQFILRFNRYENRTVNQRGTRAPVSRLLELDIYAANYDASEDEESWEEQASTRMFGLNRRATEWIRSMAMMSGEVLTEEETFRRVAEFMQMTPERLRTLQYYRPNVTETDEGLAKGYELSLYWKVNDHLNIILGGSRAEAKNVVLAPGFAEYLEERWDFWTTVRNPLTGALWWTEPPDTVRTQTPQSWYDRSIAPDWELAQAYIGTPQPNISKYTFTLRSNLTLRNLTKHRILRGMSFNMALRWQSAVGIGNYGMDTIFDETLGVERHTRYDPNRLIKDKTIVYANIGAVYKTKIYNGKIGAEFRVAIDNLFEDGGLRAVRADSNGVPTVFRIVDPRYFSFEARFSF